MEACFLSGETLILLGNDSVQEVKDLYNWKGKRIDVYSSDIRNNLFTSECLSVSKKTFDGSQVYNVLLTNGMFLRCSADTAIMTTMGFGVKVKELREGDALLTFGKTRAVVSRVEQDNKPRDLYNIKLAKGTSFIVIDRSSVRRESKELHGIIIGE